jgi:AcrR family transcriptional regulator
MPVATKRKRITKSPEDRRRDLLEAASRLFASRGVSAVTVSEIADAAGVAKGTFYLYFETKDHLLAALREQLVEETLEYISSLMARVGSDDWWGLVDAALESSVDFLLAHRDMFQVFSREGMTPATQPQFAECERRLSEAFAFGIRAGVEAGVFSVEDPEMMGVLLRNAVEGAVLQSIVTDEVLDRDRLVLAARELCHKVLVPLTVPASRV